MFAVAMVKREWLKKVEKAIIATDAKTLTQKLITCLAARPLPLNY